MRSLSGLGLAGDVVLMGMLPGAEDVVAGDEWLWHELEEAGGMFKLSLPSRLDDDDDGGKLGRSRPPNRN